MKKTLTNYKRNWDKESKEYKRRLKMPPPGRGYGQLRPTGQPEKSRLKCYIAYLEKELKYAKKELKKL